MVVEFVTLLDFRHGWLVAHTSDAAFESGEVKTHYETYHAALKEFTQRVKAQWGSGLLLDIHGEGADAAAIFRGTQNGKTVKSLLQRFGAPAVSGKQSVLGQMASKGYKVLPSNGDNDKETRYLGGYIVQSYGSHQQLGIDAIQLEFGSSLRSRANLERTARDLAHSIEVFAREYLPSIKPDARLHSAR